MTWITGPDISKWQKEVDLDKLASKSDFVIVRAGSIDNITGEPYEDFQFRRNKALAGMRPTLFYWYFRPNWSPVIQADYFADLIETVADPVVALVGDLEETGGLAPDRVTAQMAAFYDRLRITTGMDRVHYTRAEWHNRNTVSHRIWSELALWIAIHNPSINHPWLGLNQYYTPRDWSKYLLWQYTALGPAAEYGVQSLGLDMNRFYGNAQQFAEWVGKPPALDPLAEINRKLDRILEILQ